MKAPQEKPREGSNMIEPNEIDTALIETLAEIVTRLNLSELEIEQGEFKIRIARQLNSSAVQGGLAQPSASIPMMGQPATLPHAKLDHPGTVKSPMVGTAYLRPSPDAVAFVEIGSQVKAGEKLLLVEAMKTFNEIVAPTSGTVAKILIEDGQPVEYGQPLLIIE
jgi:acetyl-CoA carboxylase biotin carboxyl carrier protein